jgi:hypothetical protein
MIFYLAYIYIYVTPVLFHLLQLYNLECQILKLVLLMEKW